jgi:hypothetical protein
MFANDTWAEASLDPKATSKIPFFMGRLSPCPLASAAEAKTTITNTAAPNQNLLTFIITISSSAER